MFTFKNKSILIISPEYWGGNYISKHHYAIKLAERGNRVYFLNPSFDKNEIVKINERVLVVNYKPVFKGLRFLGKFLSSLFTRWELLRLEKQLNIQFDILWNFDSSRFFSLSLLPKRILKIYHNVDLTENFQRRLGASSSDVCLAPNDYIAQALKKYNVNSFKIRHGYSCQDSPAPVELGVAVKEKVKIGYIGNLSSRYIDWKLLNEMTKEFNHVAFVFIGPVGKSNISRSEKLDEYLIKTQELSNAYFIGSKPSSQIQALLLNFDIQLICYRADEFKEELASNHKLMEYLGSGKVVVSTFTEEFQEFPELIVMSQKNKELPHLLANVLSNLQHYNSLELINKRIQLALDNTYSRQIDRIESIINSLT